MFSLSPFAPEELVLRDGFGLVPSCVRPLILQTNQVLSCRFPRRRPHIYLQPLLGQLQIYLITLLHPDGVHCQESAGTVPVIYRYLRCGM